ncbi:MAG: branched-chain amino acid ABC transporter permease [Actinomycetota bacterium]
MATAADGPGEQVGGVRSIPWRTVTLIALSAVISAVVVVGSYRTLTLPEGQAYSGEAWRQFVILGVAQGAIYALIALGYSLVYGILRMINFAHGEIFMVGSFGAYFFADAYARSGFLDRHPFPALAIVLLAAMLVSMTIAVLLERIAYRPLRNAPRLVPLITAIGASLFLQNSARGFFGSSPKGFPVPAPLEGNWSLLGIEITRVQWVVFLVAAIGVASLSVFVSRTTTGKAMRAVAEDNEIASLMGIRVDRIVTATFALGGILAGIAGVLYSMTFGQVNFVMGFRPGIAAFTAAVLGGIGSIAGAALGGVVLGLLQAVGPALVLTGFGIPSPFQLKDAFTFLVLVLVLIFRPCGLLGSAAAEKL